MNKKILKIQNGLIKQANKTVLEEVNLSIEEGEFIYLIGKTGSGKSSLLKVLYGELKLEKGLGEVVGFDITKLRKKQIPYLRRKIGIVFQDFQLLTDRTVEENLVFIMEATSWNQKSKIKNRSKEILSMVGLKNKSNNMPHELSGGEQQRLAIGRALINNPKLILADEPTGNLDPDTSSEIMTLIFSIAQKNKTAVLMATHNLSLIEKFPARISKLENNTIKEVLSINAFDPTKTMSFNI